MSTGLHSNYISHIINSRIEEGRCSPTRYASIDVFIGPYIGRNVSLLRLRKLVSDIGAPERFQSSQPLLVVKSKHGPTKGKLVLIGGGHRLLSSSRSLHTLVLPYKLVSFEGLGPDGEDLDVFRYKGIIAFHVEVNEPRPDRYGFMEQVLLYGDLKEHWKLLEKMRVSQFKGRQGTPHVISHNKIFALYERTAGLAGSKSRWAIEFLSRKDNKDAVNKPSTRRQYMSGADRLLDVGVVPYLSYLEQIGVASFSRSSLYAVRNWSLDKVRQVVGLWRVRRETGMKVKYVFSDRIGREVDGKGRGRKANSSLMREAIAGVSSRDGATGRGEGETNKGVLSSDRRDEGDHAKPTPVCMLSKQVKDSVHPVYSDAQVEVSQLSLDPSHLNISTGFGCQTHSSTCDMKELTRTEDCVPKIDEHGHVGEGMDGATGALCGSELEGNDVHLYSNGDRKAISGKPTSGRAAVDTETTPTHLTTTQNIQEGLARKHPSASDRCTKLPETRSIKAVDVILNDLRRQKQEEEGTTYNVDLENEIMITERVKNSIQSKSVCETVPLTQLMSDVNAAAKVEAGKDIRLVARGGFMQTTITLCGEDIGLIQTFNLATDRSVMFTLSFLTKWTSASVDHSLLLDSIRSCGWWDFNLRNKRKELRILTENLSQKGLLSKELREEIWRSEVCFMPICGDGHWSLVVLLNLKSVMDVIGTKRAGQAPTLKNGNGARILFVDSIGQSSPHNHTSGNIYHYLSACYPLGKKPSASFLAKKIPKHHLRFQMQEGLECGFFVGYHVSLLSRAWLSLQNNDVSEIEVLIREGYKSYPFAQYKREVLERLGNLLKRYTCGDKRIVHASVWLWDSDVEPNTIVGNGSGALAQKWDNAKQNALQDLLQNENGAFDVPTAVEEAMVVRGSERKSGAVDCVKCEGIVPQSNNAQDILERREKRKRNSPCASDGPPAKVQALPKVGRFNACVSDKAEDKDGVIEYIRIMVDDVLGAVCCSEVKVGHGAISEVASVMDRKEMQKESKGKENEGGETYQNKRDMESEGHGGFMDIVQEALTLASRVRSKEIILEWEACKHQIAALVTRMKTDGAVVGRE